MTKVIELKGVGRDVAQAIAELMSAIQYDNLKVIVRVVK